MADGRREVARLERGVALQNAASAAKTRWGCVAERTLSFSFCAAAAMEVVDRSVVRGCIACATRNGRC